MSKRLAFASAVAMCLTLACASQPRQNTSTTANRTEKPGPRNERETSVRMESGVRTACNDVEGEAFFPYDSAEISESAMQRLDALATCLTSGGLKDRTLKLTGYTDPRGSQTYNQDLGRQRAETVANYLATKGVPRERLQVESKGEQGASPFPENWPWDRMVDVALAER